jgi:microcystin degradation protein MlrC
MNTQRSRSQRKSKDTPTAVQLAVLDLAGLRPGLVVRVRPATAFEQATWADCPRHGLRVLVDEDGTRSENTALAEQLPQAAFIDLPTWQKVLRAALRRPAS